MKKMPWAVMPALGILSLVAASGLEAAQIVRTAGAGDNGKAAVGATVSVDNLVFPSAVYGSHGQPLDQVDEIVQKLHERLAERGLGIGNMIQHTIFLKEGSVDPIQVLQRFHAHAMRLAPQLKERPSVGTIIRVPEFPNADTAVMVDAVAGAPATEGQPDDFKRITFTFGPKEIAESLAVGNTVFTAGTEAMDFEHGTLPTGIDAQIEAVVGKLRGTLQRAGLTLGDLIEHNIYVTKGNDPAHVARKFHELTQRYAPELRDRPSAGTLVVVDGMAANGFQLEMDAIAARPQPGSRTGYPRVPYGHPIEIARSVAVGDLVYLSGMEAGDSGKPISNNVFDQVDVTVKKIQATLRKSGLSIGDMVKYRLYVKKGAGDPEQVRKRFLAGVTRLAPQLKKNPGAETVLVVEALYSDALLFEASVVAARSK